jgi:hypothetical protein
VRLLVLVVFLALLVWHRPSWLESDRLDLGLLCASPDRVRIAFTPKKDTIAAALAGRFPELASRLPKPRTLTMPEHSVMPVFDATAFAMTFFYFRNQKRLGEERKAIRAAFR